ncbi:hypothetical protein BKA70DRAFT_1257070 [Coprinopsis sp. MPI-PUGE-AT-0042]|nr:hypothetical protein BKA70DRAFT_1257070 [Coprinopsis sp. MPI-PUGE-AT-0042]
MAPKRKAAESSAAANKKAKIAEEGAATVEAILSDASNFAIPDDERDIRNEMLRLAQYARSLEEDVASMKPKEKSEDEVTEEVEKLAAAVRSGIKKQLSWKPSCKTGGAKWLYDGVCNDPKVFGLMLGLGGPPTFKAKKLTTDEFLKAIGNFHGTVRYANLYLKDNVNLSGTYGV